jgi:N-acetylneuraminic acid mutarotase
MKTPIKLACLAATAALSATLSAQQITLDASNGIIGEDLTCTLSGTVPANEFVILTFSDTTGPLPVSLLLPGEPGYWDQDLSMFSYPSYLQTSAYVNPFAVVDLGPVDPNLVGVTVFGQAWTTGLGSPFLNLKSNVVTIILGKHGASTPTYQAPLSPHAYFACVPLTNGNVLCSGGGDSLGGTSTGGSEVYDYKTSTFSFTTAQPPNGPRATAASVRLNDGRVLICGGINSTGVIVNTAEIYDPATNLFTNIPPMSSPRTLHQAVLLDDGRVFVCGGSTSVSGADPVSQLLSIVSSATATAEIYNPGTNSWSAAPNMPTIRTGHIAVKVNDGRVLIAAGVQPGFLGIPSFLSSATRYNPSTNSYNSTASFSGGRALPVAAKLADGRVLMTGGINADLLAQSVTAQASVAIYNNTTNTWQNGPNMASGRYTHSMTLLPNGEMLIAGGVSGTASSTLSPTILDTCEAYTTSNTWAPRSPMLSKRAAHGAVLTKDGKRILIVGGANDLGVIAPGTAELYVP